MVVAVRHNLGLVVIAALLVAVFFHVAIDFKNKWDQPDSYYSHGYLIVPISAYLVYRKREELARLRAQPSPAGLGVLIAGCAMRLVGGFSRINVLAGSSLIVVLLGVVLYLWGRTLTWKVLFPLLFLVAMVPVPTQFVNKVSFRMKMVAARGAVKTVNTLYPAAGVPPPQGSRVDFWTRSGQHDKLVVGDVCSGLRSLIALLAFGALFAYVSSVKLWKKLLLFAASVPTALVANLLRILLILLIAIMWGSPAAVEVNYLAQVGLGRVAGTWGTAHDITGILIYVVAFIVLFSFERLLIRLGGRAQQPPGEPA